MTTLRWLLTILVAAVSGALFYFVFSLERGDGGMGSPVMILMGLGVISAIASLVTYHGLWGLAAFWAVILAIVPSSMIFAVPACVASLGLAIWHLKSAKSVQSPAEEF